MYIFSFGYCTLFKVLVTILYGELNEMYGLNIVSVYAEQNIQPRGTKHMLLAKHNIRLRQTKDTDSPLWRSRCSILLEQGVHMGISSLPFGSCTLFNV